MKSTSKVIGDVAEAKVLVYFLEKGYSVLKPVGDNLPYDLALDINGVFVRIQIKGITTKTGTIKSFKSRCLASGNYERRFYSHFDFDFLVIYYFFLNKFFVIPILDFLENKNFSVSASESAKCLIYSDRYDLIDSFVNKKLTRVDGNGILSASCADVASSILAPATNIIVENENVST